MVNLRAGLSNCQIYVYGGSGEHRRPHFHIRGPNTRLSVDIITLEIIEGTQFHRRDLDEALGWARQLENQTALLAEWRRLHERE